MPLAFSTDKTPVPDFWSVFKTVWKSKNFSPQWHDDGTVYTIYGFDGPLVHVCTIWKGEVPYTITPGYSQATNDTDKSDFETNYKSSWNRPIEVRTSDGKSIILPSLHPGGVLYYATGRGDGDTNRGDGEFMGVQVSGTGASDPDPITFDFLDWVYMSGGSVRWVNAIFGDTVSIELTIPATAAPSSTPGSGNCNLVTGPYGANTLIVPATNGSHTVDLAQAIPIPAADEVLGTASGYWDWSGPDTGKGTVTAAPTAMLGKAQWHLMTVEVIAARFLNCIPLLGAGKEDFEPQIKPKKILPHWKFRVKTHSAGRPSGTLDIVWTVKTSRVRTT